MSLISENFSKPCRDYFDIQSSEIINNKTNICKSENREHKMDKKYFFKSTETAPGCPKSVFIIKGGRFNQY